MGSIFDANEAYTVSAPSASGSNLNLAAMDSMMDTMRELQAEAPVIRVTDFAYREVSHAR